MRDVAAAHYIRETGRSWVPSAGNRISLGVTAGIVDGHAFLRARRERALNANTPQGTPVVFAVARLPFANDLDMKTFAANLLATLHKVRAHVADMYPVHGGARKVIDGLPASWADHNAIHQAGRGSVRE